MHWLCITQRTQKGQTRGVQPLSIVAAGRPRAGGLTQNRTSCIWGGRAEDTGRSRTRLHSPRVCEGGGGGEVGRNEWRVRGGGGGRGNRRNGEGRMSSGVLVGGRTGCAADRRGRARFRVFE